MMVQKVKPFCSFKSHHQWEWVSIFFVVWSIGTVCDSGVFAPVLTFQKLFEDEGVPITSAEVRAPMGVHKRVNMTWDKYFYQITSGIFTWLRRKITQSNVFRFTFKRFWKLLRWVRGGRNLKAKLLRMMMLSGFTLNLYRPLWTCCRATPIS